MAAIIKKPDKLSLSGNMNPFVVFVGIGSVSFTLVKGTDILLNQSYECGADGHVTVDVKDVVENSLGFTLNLESNNFLQTNFATFEAIIGDLSYTFTVVRAGVANLADTAGNFLKQHFLTWQPRVKEVTYYTPEWLTYYAESASNLRLKATFSDETTTEIALCTLAAGTAMTVNVQYSVIAGLLGNRYPTHYEIWAVSGDVKVSESLFYAYAESAGDDEQWFLFENSLGGIDSFRAFGVNSLNAEHEHQIAEMGDVRQEFRVDTERKFTKNTGHLDDYTRRWLLDFFPSRAKFIYEGSAIRKIVVSEDSATYKSSDLPSSYTFTFQYAEVFPYLNIQRNEEDIPSEIVVPDLASPDFILPPRLAEYPRVALTEGVLIPAFEPHLDKPTVTTVGALHDHIYESVSDYIEKVTEGLGKTLNDILENGIGGGTGGSGNFPFITSEDLLSLASDENAFTALRTLVEIRKNVNVLDDRFLRKDIDDIAAGNYAFRQSIFSHGFSISERGWQINQLGESWFDTTFIRDNIYSDTGANSFDHENGFKIWANGDGWLKNLYVKKDTMFQGDLSSPFFVSGFPAGIGWALTWRDVVNAAGVAARKTHLEIDDMTIRGILRVYEFVLSQAKAENGTLYTADAMRIKSINLENKIIYLDTEDGVLYNPFWTDDILIVQHYNGMPTVENGYYITKQYEFAVEETHIGVEEGESRVDWIKYKNFSGNELDMAIRDVLVRVDNLTNPHRKGIIKQTSVEANSPYLDIIYAMKTDPENAVRTRLGMLDGLITPYWGRLSGPGLMSDNAYLKGKFMLHTGEDVYTRFEIVDGRLESEMSALRAEISDTNNCLTNASFSFNLDNWQSTNEISFFTVDGKFLYFNSNFYSAKNKLGAVVTDGTRKALRLKNNSITQLNEFLKNKPEEQLELEDETLVWPSFYISFRCKVLSPGTLRLGFTGQDLYHEVDLEEGSVYENREYSGSWDGTGDFILSFSGDILIYSLAMTSNPLDDFKIQFTTRILQTERQILLLAPALQSVGNRVTTAESYISVMAGDISIWSGRVTSVEGRMSSAEYSLVNVIPGQISAVSSRVTTTETGIQNLWNAGFLTSPTAATLFASKNDVTAASITATINAAGEGVVKISATRIELDGTAIINIVQANNITTSKLTVTQGAKIGQFEVNTYSGLTWKGYDYFGGTAFSLGLGTSSLGVSTDVGGVIVAKSSTAERTACLAGIVSAYGIGLYGSSDGWGSNFPSTLSRWAGFFSGNTKTTGATQTSTIAAGEFRVVTSWADTNSTPGAYYYMAGIDIDPGDYDLDDIRFRVRKGIIVGVTNDSGSVLRGV